MEPKGGQIFISENRENKIEHASLSLPKGGGAITGIGEKLQANAAAGTAAEPGLPKQ